LNTLHTATGLLSRAWGWIRKQQEARSSSKRLQVAATVSLGEKRFVAVIQVDGQEFLVGGGATNVTLLAQLTAKVRFSDLLKDSMTVARTQPAERTRTQADRTAVEQMREQA
jgi:flagellar biogenesis protein FliO